MKGFSGVLILVVVGFLLIWGINYFFFPKNDGEKYVDEYISNSVEIEIEMSITD